VPESDTSDRRTVRPGEVPPGRSHNPSEYRYRMPVVLLALAGFAISVYLALFQYHVLPTVWDPIFGDGSQKVLTSPLSHLLPISDAALGAVAYLFEAVVELAGGRTRWRDRPWIVLVLGATAASLALVGVFLVISQPVLTSTFCTLCIASAAISWVVLPLVAGEVLATLGRIRGEQGQGQSLWTAVRGKGLT
jgi:Vitamin K epoxide reductase family